MNKEALKTVNIKFHDGVWNPKKHSIILEYDAKSATGFIIKLVDVDYETPITQFNEANEVLKKFTL